MQPQRAKPFHRDGWVYEEKVDGWRILAVKRGNVVRLWPRWTPKTGHTWTPENRP
jgi:ATP-dependent DNA ligase